MFRMFVKDPLTLTPGSNARVNLHRTRRKNDISRIRMFNPSCDWGRKLAINKGCFTYFIVFKNGVANQANIIDLQIIKK